MRTNISFLLFCSMLFACVPKTQTLAPLEIQALQTNEFETTKEIAFPSVLSVFQDLGYIIESADKDTGFITAKSATSDSTSFLHILGGSTFSETTRVTAFIEQIRPMYTKVRLNFVKVTKGSSAYGQQSQQDTPLLDPKIYENAFNKIGDAIFIRQETQ